MPLVWARRLTPGASQFLGQITDTKMSDLQDVECEINIEEYLDKINEEIELKILLEISQKSLNWRNIIQ